MKKKVLFIILTMAIFAFSSCEIANNFKVKNELKKYFSSEELVKLIQKIKSGEEKNIVIVDVRPSENYNKSHIPTAINIPNGIIKQPYEELKHKDLILYCETGIRVELAKKNLVKASFSIEKMLNFGSFNNYKGEIEKIYSSKDSATIVEIKEFNYKPVYRISKIK